MDPIEGYTALSTLGKGSFGTVLKVQRSSDGRVFAAKSVAYGGMNDKEKQMLVSEVNILREFQHPHIVRYFDRVIDRERKIIYIVMEYCENGDLGTYIRRVKREISTTSGAGYIPEEVIWRIYCQVLLALKECHGSASRTILHRDLKPGNIFLDAQKNVKLGDFGLARILSKSAKFAHTNVGTPYYMSPEQVNEKAYNEKSDIWSLGCLIYELGALVPPFEASNQLALAMKIRAGTYRELPATRYSSELNRVIKSMLQVEQSRRPSVDELLANPQVQLSLRERKISASYLQLKKREENIEMKEKELAAREAEIAKREKAMGIIHRPFSAQVAAGLGLDPLQINNNKENLAMALVLPDASTTATARTPEQENIMMMAACDDLCTPHASNAGNNNNNNNNTGITQNGILPAGGAAVRLSRV